MFPRLAGEGLGGAGPFQESVVVVGLAFRWATVSAEINGYIDCAVKLTGMPDLTMSFVNPRLFDDVSFHPCVRYKKWESERLLSFVPPDGNFRVMSYHVGSNSSVVAIPVYLRHSLQWVGGSNSGQVS